MIWPEASVYDDTLTTQMILYHGTLDHFTRDRLSDVYCLVDHFIRDRLSDVYCLVDHFTRDRLSDVYCLVEFMRGGIAQQLPKP